MRVFKIDTNLTDSKNKNLLKNISDEDANFLSLLDIQVSVDLLDENNFLSTVMVCNILNLEKLKTFLSKNKIQFEIEDITSEFTDAVEEEKISEYLKEINSEEILKKFGIEI
jgi:hypothetical protein